MHPSTEALPHWGLTAVYPGIESEEFGAALQSVVDGIDQLGAEFDAHDISRQEPRPLDDETLVLFETLLQRMDALERQAHTVEAYLYGHIATDSRDEVAQARWSKFQQALVNLSLLDTRFTAWVGSLDVEAAIERSTLAREHAFPLRKTQEASAHQMAPEEEALAAELDLVAGRAWAKLHGTFTSQLSVPLELDGEVQDLPMSAVRNLSSRPERDVRRRAYEAELEVWERMQVPLAAAMNGIKGQVNILSRRRRWDTPLDQALFGSNIDRQTFEAMMEAARESFSDFRHYLKAKAQLLGLENLAWYDLFAPVGEGQRAWAYGDARTFILEQFGTFSERLRGLAERAFAEQWIDAEPRTGKRDGAFCMWIADDMSRILANYRPVYGGMSTLAHELGHAYHNLNLSHRTMLQRSTPMTLAETASIFCQTIVRQAAMADASPTEQLTILEAYLQGACQVVVDISSRFVFERRVFEQRQGRDMSPSEYCQLMVEAQLETYGDGLDSEALHPYMWAVKPHYYSAGRSFYNYPYMFGLLFGLGLYAQYQADPEGFRSSYDELLASTGMDDAASLAARFGIEIQAPGFWRASLDIVRDDIVRFVSLVEQSA